MLPTSIFESEKLTPRSGKGEKKLHKTKKKTRKNEKKKYLGAGRFPIFVYSVHVKHVRIESKVG
jgi:hypothetical protein